MILLVSFVTTAVPAAASAQTVVWPNCAAPAGAQLCDTARSATTTITLEQCRQWALKHSNQLKIGEEKKAAAEALRRAAMAEFFPQLMANGIYNWNQQGMQLLSDDQQSLINNMGTTAYNRLTAPLLERVADLPYGQEQLRGLIEELGNSYAVTELNALGRDITQSLDIDMRNVYAGSVNIAQPVYMGGKLRALYRCASLSCELQQLQQEQAEERLMMEVDESYWRVVSVQHKQQLAQQYYDLLDRLSQNVEAMIEAEVASPSDASQVRVKKNEAQMKLTQANVGLKLSRMVLNQIIGLPLDTVYNLEESALRDSHAALDSVDAGAVAERRTEMQMLRLGEGIAEAGVQAARSALLPNVGVTAGYAVSNPNFINGYEQAFGGSFTAGVVVNVPICPPAAINTLQAAKHRRNEVRYQLDEAREKLVLQVNKLNLELQVANEKLQQTQANLTCANENLRLATESFQAGLIGVGDLMQAQTAWLSAQTDIIEAEVEARMSWRYLQQALGCINQY